MLLGCLIACMQVRYVDTCTNLDAAEITDPEGLAGVDDVAALDAARTRFDAWTGELPICVDEIRIVGIVDPEVPEIGGRWIEDEGRVELGWNAWDQPVDVLFHELCHALDSMTGLSFDLEGDLPAVVLDEEIYSTEALRRKETFAQFCAAGPPPRALYDAYEARCGSIPDVARDRRDRVWVGWGLDEPALGDAGWVSAEATVFEGGWGGVSDGDRVYQFGYGDDPPVGGVAGPVFATDQDGETRRVWQGISPDLVPAVGGGAPLVLQSATSEAWELHAHGLRPADADWLFALASTDAAMGLDRDWYQTWGDGQPLQVRDRATGAVWDQPGDEGLALRAPLAWSDGAPVTIGYLDVPAPTAAYRLTETGVEWFGAPWGIDSVVPLPDGRWVGWGFDWSGNFGISFWVVRGATGEWGLSGASCRDGAPVGPVLRVGDGVFNRQSELIVVGE